LMQKVVKPRSGGVNLFNGQATGTRGVQHQRQAKGRDGKANKNLEERKR